VADITNSKIVLLRNQAAAGLSAASFGTPPHSISTNWKPYGSGSQIWTATGKMTCWLLATWIQTPLRMLWPFIGKFASQGRD
jgi:hypothetical protein